MISGAVIEENIWGHAPFKPRHLVANTEGGKIEASKAPSGVAYGRGVPSPAN